MATLKVIADIGFIVVSIILSIIVLMQEGKSAGLGTLGGMASNTDSYWSKNKGRSAEGVLIKSTRVLLFLFLGLALVLNMGFWS